MRTLAVLLVTLLVAGCATPAPAQDTPGVTPGEARVGNALLHAGGIRGGLALVHLSEGDAAEVALPENVLILSDDGGLVPGGSTIALARGEIIQFVAPYGADSLNVTVGADGETGTLLVELTDGRPFVRGDRVVDLLKEQRDRFAHRTPGHENYTNAVEFFGEFFANLSYEVETFRTPLPDLGLPVGPAPSTQSVVSVLGTKRGTDMAERYIVIGGHFDVVEQTTHGAFDNTGGTVATLALAEAFANITTSRSIIFAAWGGEEDGILGSQAWVLAHPELVPFIDLYINYDVTGLAWPAPLVDPAPVVFASGPDGPLGDALAAQHRTVLADWMQLDAPFVYESVAGGQATGAGVNAQSDHTPFMTRGIPVVFQFTSRVEDVFGIIHSEADTVENMTAYALLGPEGIGQELAPEDVRAGEEALAKSFETQLLGGFYLVILTDNGVLSPVRAPPSLRLLDNARS